MIDKTVPVSILCLFRFHKWKRYKDSRTYNPVRICDRCDRHEECFYDMFSWSWRKMNRDTTVIQ